MPCYSKLGINFRISQDTTVHFLALRLSLLLMHQADSTSIDVVLEKLNVEFIGNSSKNVLIICVEQTFRLNITDDAVDKVIDEKRCQMRSHRSSKSDHIFFWQIVIYTNLQILVNKVSVEAIQCVFFEAGSVKLKYKNLMIGSALLK